MTQYLMRIGTAVSVPEVAAPDGPACADNPHPSAFDALLVAQGERRREARLAAEMSPKAAALLPLMMSMARLQARLDHQERGK